MNKKYKQNGKEQGKRILIMEEKYVAKEKEHWKGINSDIKRERKEINTAGRKYRCSWAQPHKHSAGQWGEQF